MDIIFSVATLCSESLCFVCSQHADNKTQWHKPCSQKQMCLWQNKNKNTTILKCFSCSYILNQFPLFNKLENWPMTGAPCLYTFTVMVTGLKLEWLTEDSGEVRIWP